LQHYYDFEHKEFFYTKDLFSQSKKGILAYVESKSSPHREKGERITHKLFSHKTDFYQVAQNISNRVAQTEEFFEKALLNELKDFHRDLRQSLLKENPALLKSKRFFRQYVDKIAFIPRFNAFGLSNYFLYILPYNMAKIDYKLLLSNTFTSVEYPACIQDRIPLLVSYLFPFRTPNKSYLNFIAKSRRKVAQYCLFTPTTFHDVFHFEYNLSDGGWHINPNYFKIYAKKILFQNRFTDLKGYVKSYELGEKVPTRGYKSPAFANLRRLYEWGGTDIKSYLGTIFKDKARIIKSLLQKDLIIPYIHVKSLNLVEKLYILLPHIKSQSDVKTLIRIFSFFNLAHIFEIEGEFFLESKDLSVKKFRHGLFITLFLPNNVELSAFQKIFVELFHYFDLSRFLILSDYAAGDHFLTDLYGKEQLAGYNPYKNLDWNSQDGKWKNIKLFGEHLVKKYPPLRSDTIQKELT
jgi:hypothetical protein